jgi:TusA-related sulfurtransferase
MAQTIDLDIRGQICPSCLLLTLKELNQNAAAIRASSIEIVVTTDDRQATATIPATAERMGFGTEVTRLEDGSGYRIRVFNSNS